MIRARAAAMTHGYRGVYVTNRRDRMSFDLAFCAILAVFGAALPSCGGGDLGGGEGASGTGAGSGAGTSGTGAGEGDAGPPATGCANFDNWQCIVAGYQCLARCEQHQIACDGFKCARATSATSSEICADVAPQQLDDCGDCRAAFEAGCL